VPTKERQYFYKHMCHSEKINENVYQGPLPEVEILKVDSHLRDMHGKVPNLATVCLDPSTSDDRQSSTATSREDEDIEPDNNPRQQAEEDVHSKSCNSSRSQQSTSVLVLRLVTSWLASPQMMDIAWSSSVATTTCHRVHCVSRIRLSMFILYGSRLQERQVTSSDTRRCSGSDADTELTISSGHGWHSSKKWIHVPPHAAVSNTCQWQAAS